jgi:SAM-dependent methyltransferase
MSHQQQLSFVASVKDQFPEYFSQTKVLEVGSLNINGSVRQFFENPDKYIGCDLGEGPGVDIVCRGHELPYPDGVFDVVISCECFEHDKHWEKTFQKMIDLAREGGLVIFSCATIGRPEHGTSRASPIDAPFTNDYYQNLREEDFNDFKPFFKQYKFGQCLSAKDLYFWGLK